VFFCLLNGIMGATFRSESETIYRKCWVNLLFDYLENGLLHKTVFDRWDSKLSFRAILFWYFYTFDRLWLLRAIRDLPNDLISLPCDISHEPINSHSIHARYTFIGSYSLKCKI